MTNERLIVGFCGPIGCGKSTAAKYLCERYDFERRRFAGPLKDMMLALGLTHDEVDGDLKEKPCELLGGKTPRHAMQTLGTEWGRNLIDSDLWVRAFERELSYHSYDVAADDVRFSNEAKVIKKHGGILIRLERDQKADIHSHASETQHLQPDITIWNSGTHEQLYGHLDWCLSELWSHGKVA